MELSMPLSGEKALVERRGLVDKIKEGSSPLPHTLERTRQCGCREQVCKVRKNRERQHLNLVRQKPDQMVIRRWCPSEVLKRPNWWFMSIELHNSSVSIIILSILKWVWRDWWRPCKRYQRLQHPARIPSSLSRIKHFALGGMARPHEHISNPWPGTVGNRGQNARSITNLASSPELRRDPLLLAGCRGTQRESWQLEPVRSLLSRAPRSKRSYIWVSV